MRPMTANVLLIACGALAREIVELTRLNGWEHVRIQCLPAELHNRPERIPDAVRTEIEGNRDSFEHIFVAYADCGTGGHLDLVLEEFGIERLPGAHCYEFFAGTAAFEKLSAADPATFYLTDFLTRHFDRLIRRGLGLDRHPELMEQYFGNYSRLVYLAQTKSPGLELLAREHAAWLGLGYEYVFTGLDNVDHNLSESVIQWRN
jgi:hypothetical protein